MANNPIRMTLLKQIIALKQKGFSNRGISKRLGISRKTANKYVRLWEQSDTGKQTAQDFSSLLLPAASDHVEERLAPLQDFFPYVERELQRTGVTRQLLWREYQQQGTHQISYTRFCVHFRQWRQGQQVTMHLEHKAGDKLMVDFTGKKLSVVDPITGEVQTVEVFVAILAASQYTYVEALADQTLASFLRAVENALYFLGGVPQAIVPDNLKAAVTKSSRYEPLVNQTLEDFAHYYGTVILPTRAYKPRDKALVEGAVKIVYTRIFAPLRDQVFTSLPNLNEAIRSLLEAYNSVAFKGREQSRYEQFMTVEREVLQALPVQRYEYKKYVKATVYKNSHVWLGEDKHYYSVPYRYISKRVRIIYTASLVEVYYQHERIAAHPRQKGFYGYTSQKDHLPSAHQFVADWNPEKFLTWAGHIGPHTRELVAGILNSKPHPEQGYKASMGILALARKVGNERLEKACIRALHYQTYSYRVVKNILDKGLEELDDTPTQNCQSCFTMEHENLRGNTYYQ